MDYAPFDPDTRLTSITPGTIVIADDTGLILTMPRKVRQLIADLERAGFIDRGGKGSHRNFVHSKGHRITVSGKSGDDAKHYQERDVRRALEAVNE